MNYYSDQPEWKYLLRNAIDWDTIIPLYYPSFPTSNGFNTKEELIEFFEQVLDATGKWSGETLRERARELDEVGCAKTNPDGSVKLTETMLKTYSEAVKLDVFGISVDEKYGGLGAPVSITMLMVEQLARACISTSTQLAFFTGMADMLERFCDHATCERLIPQIIKGQLSGSMCLTESDAGSDVGSLRTSAEKQPDGRYSLNGTKMFITNAGGGFGFVLARIKGAPEGLSGISMFLSEEKVDGKQNYRITKIEDKMGMHGSMTCEVVYENSIATLIGQENEGFKYMLHLMNEARISVGIQSIGGIEAGLERVQTYAETRKQFGKTLLELPLFKRNLDDWVAEQDAFRAFMVDTISSFDIFQRLDMKERHGSELNEQEKKLHRTHHSIVRARTPLVKYMGAEMYGMLSVKTIQAFGGYGYMKEYDVERIHRDCFGALLYEGTSQIQALMAMKDFVKKVTKNPAKFIQSMMAAHPVSHFAEKNEYKNTYQSIQYEFQKSFSKLLLSCFMNPNSGFMDALTYFNQLFSKEYWQDSTKLERVMTHAETLCQALSMLEVIKVLGKQAAKDESRKKLFDDYLLIARPRFQAIYADWQQRS